MVHLRICVASDRLEVPKNKMSWRLVGFRLCLFRSSFNGPHNSHKFHNVINTPAMISTNIVVALPILPLAFPAFQKRPYMFCLLPLIIFCLKENQGFKNMLLWLFKGKPRVRKRGEKTSNCCCFFKGNQQSQQKATNIAFLRFSQEPRQKKKTLSPKGSVRKAF